MAVLTGGCAEPRNSLATVVDSAGAAIVSNLPGSLEGTARWSLSTDPVLDIGGGSDPHVPLYRVTAVTPLRSGRVAVGMTTPPQAFVFDEDGVLFGTLGRDGEGPGEFSSVGSVVFLEPDSLAVWDPDRRRVSVFTESGTFQREVDLGVLAPMSSRASSNTQSASGFTHLVPSLPGSVVLFGEAVLGPASDQAISRHEMPAHRIDVSGRLLATYGSFPGLQTSPGLVAPFGARTHAAGGRVLVVGTSEVPEYRVYSPDGRLSRIVRWPDTDRTVRGDYLSRWLAMVRDEDPPVAAYIEAAPRAERVPAYDDLLTSDRGDVLVAEYPGPLGIMPLRRADPAPEAFKPQLRMPARRWLVFDSLGTAKASLDTPVGFEPYALQEEILWGVYTDELDVEAVRAYRVTR